MTAIIGATSRGIFSHATANSNTTAWVSTSMRRSTSTRAKGFALPDMKAGAGSCSSPGCS
jgi:hypothetical protein